MARTRQHAARLKSGPMVAVLVLACVLSGLGHSAGARSPRSVVPTWSVDPGHTKIGFSIDAVGFPRTEGVFTRFDGRIGIDLDRPTASRVSFRVDAASVDVGSDLLADLLRGSSFLDIARHPDVTFQSRTVTKLDDHSVRVVGDMTILGVTRALSVDVEVHRMSAAPPVRLGFTARATIDRLAFGMREGYPLIGRDVALTVASQAVER